MLAQLSGPTDIAGFRGQAGQLLARQVPPDEVQWQAAAPHALVHTDPAGLQGRHSGPARAAAAIVPPSFQRLCELVVQHRDPDRFALLYRLLWRLVHEPSLRADPLDADLAHAQHMAHAVRRDIHKAKTQLRFRAVEAGDGALQLAWLEPVHHIVETVARWHVKREPSARWALLSGDCCAYSDGRELLFAPALAAAPGDSDADWLAAWRAAFPAGA